MKRLVYMKYPIIIEQALGNYSAYSPDVPGCGTVGDTIEETKQNIVEALEFHFEGLLESGLSIPEPTLGSKEEYVEVQIPQLS